MLSEVKTKFFILSVTKNIYLNMSCIIIIYHIFTVFYNTKLEFVNIDTFVVFCFGKFEIKL